MDNLAHSLVGAALAEAGLKKTTPLATATLIIGANFADIDGLAMFMGDDFALWFRRGWTHGVLAAVILPAVLVGIMLAYDKWWRRRRDPQAEPAKLGALVGLSYLAFLTHPFLDWLNTYGVRLLMPFDGRWFYGDSLFIIDPWLWLLCASSVILAHSSSKISITGWTVLGCAATALVWGYGEVPLAVKIVWGVSVAIIVTMRLRGWFENRTHQIATVTVCLAAVYIAVMVSGTLYARHFATQQFAQRGVEVENILAGPVPGNPMKREGVIKSAQSYRFFAIEPLGERTFTEPYEAVPVDEPGPVVEAALAAESVRGMVNWMRFPSYEVRAVDDGGYLVIIRDLRYAMPDEDEGFGVASVRLNEDLEPF